jgi:hypothetical protein
VTFQKTPDREVYLIINNKEVGEYPTKALAIQKLKKMGYNVVPPMRGFE